MFHLKPLMIGTFGLGVALLTILPVKQSKAPICYDCSIELIKKKNDSLIKENNILYLKVKDTLEMGKKAIAELEILKERVNYFKPDIYITVDTIVVTKEIHDSFYFTKEYTTNNY
jgi:hypothetical protein